MIVRELLFPVVLDGGLAVPCNPKPAHAGSKGTPSAARCGLSLKSGAAMKIGSGEDSHREPRQDRKVATVNGAAVRHRGAWLELFRFKPPPRLCQGPGTTGFVTV